MSRTMVNWLSSVLRRRPFKKRMLPTLGMCWAGARWSASLGPHAKKTCTARKDVMGVTSWLDFTHYTKPMYNTISWLIRVRYDLVAWFGTIQSCGWFVYNIYLRATTTMILSIGGVTIPINLVSSAMDSIRRCVVLFKSVPISTSEPKPEFLCQLSVCCAEPADPLNHLVCLGYLPRLHPSRITLMLKVPVLLLSTSSRSCSSN